MTVEASTEGATPPDRVTRADGTTLAVAEYGAPDGWPVVCFHGNPGSRLLWRAYDAAARDQDLRLIAPDRPGFGRSPYDPTHTVGGFHEDVLALAEALDLDSFGVIGFSAGGAYAASMASAAPDRVTTAVLVSSVSPPAVQRDLGSGTDRLGQLLLEHVPGAARAMFGVTALLADRRPDRLERILLSDASEHDEAVFEDSLGELLLADARETFHQDSRGAAHEFPQLGADWGVDLDTGHAPLSLWHGRNDGTVPIERAKAAETYLPEADLTVVADGHYSTLIRNADAILADVRP